jgi:hypothetical protein
MSVSKRSRLNEDAENYETLMLRVTTILKQNFYIINEAFIEEHDYYKRPTYTFNLTKNNTPGVISTVIISIMKDMTNKQLILTRTSEPTWSTNFHIEEVETAEPNRRKGLATLLMIYGMCFVKTKKPNISFFTLYDCSGQKTDMTSNIYTILGFEFQSRISIDASDSSKITFTCPEKPFELKQLALDDKSKENLFIRRASKQITKIIEKTNTQTQARTEGGIKKTKKQKNQKQKNQKQKNTKIQKHKNKKTKTKKQKQKTKKPKNKKQKTKTKKHKPLKFKHFNSALHQHK